MEFCGDEVTLFEPLGATAPAEGSIDTSTTPDDVTDNNDVTATPAEPAGAAAASAPSPRPLSFATFMQTIEKKLTKINKSTENLEKGVKKLKIFKSSKPPPAKPCGPVKAPPHLPQMDTKAVDIHQEEIYETSRDEEEQEIKRRSHQRAEQIKKAREEFLGISNEQELKEMMAVVSSPYVVLREEASRFPPTHHNRKSLDVPSLRRLGDSEANSRSCPSSPRGSRSKAPPPI